MSKFSWKKGLFDFVLAGILVMLLQENREMKERKEKEQQAAKELDLIENFRLEKAELQKELEYMHDENRTLERVKQNIIDDLEATVKEQGNRIAAGKAENARFLKEVDGWKAVADERHKLLKKAKEEIEKLKNEWVEKTAKADGYV